VSGSLQPLGPVATARPAEAIVAALELPHAATPATGRPRVATTMIESADGRATVAGTSSPLGHPADTALLRELRTAVDAILVGTGTLRAEAYAHVLDDDQRARRVARGLEAQPLVAGGCVDHYLVTVAPLLAAGPAPRILEGDALAPPARLRLHQVHRADEHLFTHYVPVP
jgi:riboflavin biosynthesis pyrimidine reductase